MITFRQELCGHRDGRKGGLGQVAEGNKYAGEGNPDLWPDDCTEVAKTLLKRGILCHG